MIKPILPFKAMDPKSKREKIFTQEDDFKPDSELARTALLSGCLSEKDAPTVRKAVAKAAGSSNTDAPEGKAVKVDI